MSDAEIARQIPGPPSRHQQVNARCRALQADGLIRREKRHAGPILNFPDAATSDAEGSDRPRAEAKRPPRGAVGRCPAVPPGGPANAVSTTSVTVVFFWQGVGEISLGDDGKPHFPHLQELAGVYRIRLTADRSVYVGEAVNLRRRMQNYRTPGQRQATSIWVNALLRERLGAQQVVLLEACISASLSVDGAEKPADLGSKAVRVAVEHAAILAERRAGWTPLNRAN